MAELTWMRVAQTTDALAKHLRDTGTLAETHLPSSSCDDAVDHWVNQFAGDPFPEFVLPHDPVQRKGLLLRLEYAAFTARQNELQNVPPPARLSQADVFKFLLIEQWHRSAAGSEQHALTG